MTFTIAHVKAYSLHYNNDGIHLCLIPLTKVENASAK